MKVSNIAFDIYILAWKKQNETASLMDCFDDVFGLVTEQCTKSKLSL